MSEAQTNDLQTLADKLLDEQIAAQPHLDEIERLKAIFAEATTTAGQALRFASSKGLVETRKGSDGGLKGTALQFDEQKFQLLPETMRNELTRLGVVTTVNVYGKVSKPAVSIKPVFPPKAAKADNDNATKSGEAAA